MTRRKTKEYKHQVKCPACNGTGGSKIGTEDKFVIDTARPCLTCFGKGMLDEKAVKELFAFYLEVVLERDVLRASALS